ncbi:DUF1905 domain-containing protein [Solirubrobacter sp. CPCC 204708]|uniref:DUF1905 domain-containing protein n=1 Tax=Solirubrobacter deserti TaxID=2282478 RepID=A0ABT4RHP8_9ACTN|nr:DUF1905 domain-containing protein [Solirubrobacter deserti]MBE2316523.1 DUF1905 domain-containing protein [Solirubrobacter deserti]MDA0138056.1 DUF1905 domain-containing protein [Solirubrobacter deserti]
MTHTIRAEVWLHPGEAGWHFVTLPEDVADEVRARVAAAPSPFGMARVEARIGATRWSTSLYADTRRASFLLPIKGEVRRREGIVAGDDVEVELRM